MDVEVGWELSAAVWPTASSCACPLTVESRSIQVPRCDNRQRLTVNRSASGDSMMGETIHPSIFHAVDLPGEGDPILLLIVLLAGTLEGFCPALTSS